MARISRQTLTLLLALATALPVLSGCDSQSSKMAAMRARAIRRPSEDDDDGDPPPKALEKKKVEADKPEPKAPSSAQGSGANDPVKPEVKVEPSRRQKPESPLNGTDARAWALQNLNEIAQAMVEFREQNGAYPRNAIRDGAGVPLLSWRVAMLPHLGYQALYEKFNLEQPWDSPTNLKLIDEIPPVYLSGSRLDGKTNILVPVGKTSLFNIDGKRVRAVRVEDGFKDTLLLIEVDDALAVLWTQPLDFDADGDPRGLGTKRTDGIFVAFADGLLRRIPVTIKPHEFKGLLTIDGGEPITVAKVSMAVAADPTRASDVDNRPYEELASLGGLGAAMAENDGQSGEGDTDGGRGEPVEEIVPDDRPEPPPESSLAESRKLFRELYLARYKQANTPQRKEELAQELIQKSETLVDDANARYVMLQAARMICNEIPSLPMGKEVIQSLTQEHRLDDHPMKVELLMAVGSRLPQDQIELSMEVAQTAVARDDFETASKLAQLATAAFNRNNNQRTENDPLGDELTVLRRRVQAGLSDYRKFRKAMDEAQQGTPEAHAIAGKYLCFVKDDWLRGLPLLAAGSDETLRELSKLELSKNLDPMVRMEIAEGWWEYGKEATEHRHAKWRHAALWFLAAEDSLPDGLIRVKAEMRVNELAREIGEPVIQELRGQFGPASRAGSGSARTARRRQPASDGDDD